MSGEKNVISKILIFDIKGPMAHFRKFYTNSSSLSYLFPPRTVVAGIIAGILGKPSERFSKDKNQIYYELLNEKNCFIGLGIKSKIRKIMQTVNYSFTKTQNNQILFGKPTQIPLEILLTKKFGNELQYRIYFSHSDNKIYNDFKYMLSNNKFIYSPYLGITEFLASIKFINETEVEANESNGSIKISSVCKLNDIELNFDKNGIQYLVEKMPTGFLNDRTPLETEDYVVEVNNGTIWGQPKTKYYSLFYSENDKQIKENILFI